MQLVGATQWFIIKPFVRRSAVLGAAGAAIAFVLCGLIYMFFTRWISGNFALPDPYFVEGGGVIAFIREYSILFAALIILGMVIAVLGTIISTRKYLRLKIDELY